MLEFTSMLASTAVKQRPE